MKSSFLINRLIYIYTNNDYIKHFLNYDNKENNKENSIENEDDINSLINEFNYSIKYILDNSHYIVNNNSDDYNDFGNIIIDNNKEIKEVVKVN